MSEENKKYLVMKYADIENYVDDDDLKGIQSAFVDIAIGRSVEENKYTNNEYIVINTDEPYIDEIIEIMRHNGHWN